MRVDTDWVACGYCLRLSDQDQTGKYSANLVFHTTEYEKKRFAEARKETVNSLVLLSQQAQRELGEQAGLVFQYQRMTLDDEQFNLLVCQFIEVDKLNAEQASLAALKIFQSKIGCLDDHYLQSRTLDLDDMINRLHQFLDLNHRDTSSVKLDRPTILIASQLMPSDVLQLDPMIKGLVFTRISSSSHTCILARAKGVPVVIAADQDISSAANDDLMLIDAGLGKVWLNPEPDVLEYYSTRPPVFETLTQHCQTTPACAGWHVKIWGNAVLPEDVDVIKKHGGLGVGLLRTEWLFRHDTNPPDEDAQFAVYRAIMDLTDQVVTFRTFDPDHLSCWTQFESPDKIRSKSLRGIRYSLNDPDNFRLQIRAIVRAGQHGKIRILLPMITTVVEFELAKKIINVTCSQLVAEGHPVQSGILLGAMIETPAAVMISTQLAQKADFLSIGTNDLCHFTMSDNKGFFAKSEQYSHIPMNIFNLINKIITAARLSGRELNVCGEMAADPTSAIILIGMGIRNLSVAPAHIPHIRRLLSQISLAECAESANSFLASMKQVFYGQK